ncbi:hypothetical protein KI387_043476, partial [Taxus chinensis]
MEEEDEMRLMEEDSDGCPYYDVFIPKRFLDAPEEDIIMEPSDENQRNIMEEEVEDMKIESPFNNSICLEAQPIGGIINSIKEDPCCKMDDPMLSEDSTNDDKDNQFKVSIKDLFSNFDLSTNDEMER